MLRDRNRLDVGGGRADRFGSSILGLGTAALGRPAYITTGHGEDLVGHNSVEEMEARAHQVFDFAYEHGVRYFDTARSYGEGEKFLAGWVEARRPDGLFIASKWGYRYVAGWQTDVDVHEVKDHSIDAFRRQLAETLALFDGGLDLYQIHSVTPESPVLDDRELLDELGGLKASGVAIGLTTSGARQGDVIARAAAVEVGGEPLFDAVQATWNVLETSSASALTAASEVGVVVVVKEALANGRLTDRGDHPLRLPGGHASSDAIALHQALRQPFADVVLSGATSVAQLASNLTALDLGDPLDDAVLPTPVDPERYWSERSARSWT